MDPERSEGVPFKDLDKPVLAPPIAVFLELVRHASLRIWYQERDSVGASVLDALIDELEQFLAHYHHVRGNPVIYLAVDQIVKLSNQQARAHFPLHYH